MGRYFDNKREIDEAFEKYLQTPANRRLKHIAFGAITIAIALLLTMTFFGDDISWTVMLIMRGCAGVLAIVFVILISILSYRANSSYIHNHRKPNK